MNFHSSPSRFLVIALLASAVVAQQSEAFGKADQLIEKARTMLESDPGAALQQLKTALQELDGVDPKKDSFDAMFKRWTCGQMAYPLVDKRQGEEAITAFQGVIDYYERDGGKLLEEAQGFEFCQVARGCLGDVYDKSLEFEDARDLRKKVLAAWEKHGNKVKAAQALASLGQTEVLADIKTSMGWGAVGLDHLRQAYDRVCAEPDADRAVAGIARLYANMLVDMGQDFAPQLLTCQQRALEIHGKWEHTTTEDIRELLNLKWETANTLMKHLYMIEARKLAQEALDLAEKHFTKDSMETFWPRGFLSMVLESMGDLQGALLLREQNRDLCVAKATLPSEELMRGWNAYGHALWLLRDLDKAIEAFKKAQDAVDPSESTPIALGSTASLYDNLGQCYAEKEATEKGSAKKGVRALEKAMEIVTSRPEMHLAVSRVEGGLAMALQRDGKLEKAAEHYKNSVPDVVATSGNFRQAAFYLKREALTLAALRNKQADLKKRLDEMIDLARRAAKQCFLLPGRPSYELASVADGLAQTVISLAPQLMPADRDQLTRDAFESLESLRGIELRVTRLARQLASSSESDAVKAKVAAAGLARAHLARLMGTRASQEEFNAAVRDRDRMEDELFALVQSIGHVNLEQINAESIAVQLGEDCAAVAFRAVTLTTPATGENKGLEKVEMKLIAFVVTRKGAEIDIKQIDLGPLAKIHSAADSWLKAILKDATMPEVKKGKKPVAGPASELDMLVMDKIKRKLPGNTKKLVVCLDDCLHRIPLELTPAAADLELRYAVSFADLFRNHSAATPDKPSMFLVGGVDFESRPGTPVAAANGEAADSEATAEVPATEPLVAATRAATVIWDDNTQVSRATFKSLGSAADEANAIAELFRTRFKAKCTPAGGKDVSRELFVERAQKASYLHLATHGYVLQTDRNKYIERDDLARAFAPMTLCGLALSGANQTSSDGFVGVITGEEIAGLDLQHCQLAVLSACDSALGEARAGHGLASLQGALHAAGAKAVVATRWQIPDKAASEFMKLFYGYLWAGNMTPRAALEKAKQELRKRPGFEPIVNWGGFVLTGDVLE